MFAFITQILVSILLFLASLRLHGCISFDFPALNSSHVIEIHPSACVTIILAIFWIYKLISFILLKLLSFFRGKSPQEKGLDSLQVAVSGILIKDRYLASKSLQKARRYLGNIPLVSWLEGQFMILNKDFHQAKAVFYELSAREKNTALGAYSICSMSLQDHSSAEALNAIDNIVRVYPHAYELIFQAIALCIRKNDYSKARNYLPKIRNIKKSSLIEGIIYAEEGAISKGNGNNNINLLEKAFKIAPELVINAINYSEVLKKNGEYRRARQILLESFSHVHFPRLYACYMACFKKPLELSDQLQFAEKIAETVPGSWLAYFKLAEIALRNNMLLRAFQNFFKAYEMKPYSFIKDQLDRCKDLMTSNEEAKKDGEDSEEFAVVTEASETDCESIISFWKCHHCGYESKNWKPVCYQCGWIGEYQYSEKELSDMSQA